MPTWPLEKYHFLISGSYLFISIWCRDQKMVLFQGPCRHFKNYLYFLWNYMKYVQLVFKRITKYAIKPDVLLIFHNCKLLKFVEHRHWQWFQHFRGSSLENGGSESDFYTFSPGFQHLFLMISTRIQKRLLLFSEMPTEPPTLFWNFWSRNHSFRFNFD